jgi:ribosomal-protein-alanine N-acetyltransferase
MNDNNYIIRPLTPSDIAELVEIEYSTFKDPWTVEGFRGILRSPVMISLGIFKKELLGYVISSLIVDEFHILNFAVKPGKRGKGIGGKLFDYILENFQKKIKFIYLEVRASNQTALSFYEHRGFKSVGLRKKYYPDGEDAVLMTKEVDSGR